MRKPKRLAALCAAFLMGLCLCSAAVHAEEASAGPASSAPIGTVLPPGTGKVAEVYADENGRKFYTIQTPAGNTFYLIIDFTKEAENVYFLDAVSEKDLLALAEKAGGALPIETESSAPTTAPGASSSAPIGGETGEQPKAGTNGLFGMALIGAVVLIGGGAGLYFKVLRKRQGKGANTEYEEEAYSPDEPEDDLPPWDNEQEDDHV